MSVTNKIVKVIDKMILNVKTLAVILVTAVVIHSEPITSNNAFVITRQCIFTSKYLLLPEELPTFATEAINEDDDVCNVEFTIPKALDFFDISVNYTADSGNRIQMTTYQDGDVVGSKTFDEIKNDGSLYHGIMSVTPRANTCNNFKLEITKPKNENTIITSLQIFFEKESFKGVDIENFNCKTTVTTDEDELELVFNEGNVDAMTIDTIPVKTNNVIETFSSENYKNFRNDSGRGFWNALTISIVAIAAAAVLGVTIVSAYYCGKNRTLDKEFSASDINVDTIEPPSTITVPRVRNYYVDLQSERLSRANSYK